MMFAVDAACDEPTTADMWSCATGGGVPTLAWEGLVQTPRWSCTGARFNTQLSSKSRESKTHVKCHLQKCKQYFMKTFYTKIYTTLNQQPNDLKAYREYTTYNLEIIWEAQGIRCKSTDVMISIAARWDAAQMASGSTSGGFTHHRVRQWE